MTTGKSNKTPIRKPKGNGPHGATSIGNFPPGHPIRSMGPMIFGMPDPPKKKEGKDD